MQEQMDAVVQWDNLIAKEAEKEGKIVVLDIQVAREEWETMDLVVFLDSKAVWMVQKVRGRAIVWDNQVVAELMDRVVVLDSRVVSVVQEMRDK